jgi:hypothetical protein
LDIPFSNFTEATNHCYLADYVLSQSDSEFEIYSDIGAPTISEYGFSLTIVTARIRDYVFYILGLNEYGDSVFSPMVTISVIENDQKIEDTVESIPVLVEDLTNHTF